MRRVGFIAVAAMALLALGAGGVDARHAHTSSVSARTNTAVQGGMLHVQAKVKHAQHGASFSASAVVHFASGDVTVQLKRHGKSFVAAAKVPVSSDETTGDVPVSVTVDYNDTEQEVETDATVEDDGLPDANDQGDDQGDDTCDPATTTCTGDDQGDNTGGDDQGDDDSQATCDPATTTCDDQGDQGGDDQGGDDQGDDPGTDG